MEKGVPPCGNTPIDFYISNIFNVSATSWALHPTFPDRLYFFAICSNTLLDISINLP